MNRVCVRVVKIGGSLLDYQGLVPSLRQWVAGQSSAVHVLLAGGGRFADAVRQTDSCLGLGQEAAHWLCVSALGLTARLLAELLPDAPLVAEWFRLQQLCRSGPPNWVVFDPEPFLLHHEAHWPGTRLPHGWHATSDSIAARLAEVLGCGEVVLLKSVSVPRGTTLEQAAQRGYVDAFFPLAAQRLSRVRLVNLRDARPTETCLGTAGTG